MYNYGWHPLTATLILGAFEAALLLGSVVVGLLIWRAK